MVIWKFHTLQLSASMLIPRCSDRTLDRCHCGSPTPVFSGACWPIGSHQEFGLQRQFRRRGSPRIVLICIRMLLAVHIAFVIEALYSMA